MVETHEPKVFHRDIGITACYLFSHYGPAFTGPQVIEGIERAAGLGFRQIELETIRDEQVSIFVDDSLRQVQAVLAKHGITVPIFAAFNSAKQLVSPDPAERAKGLEKFEQSCEISVALDCPHIQIASAVPDELVGAAHLEYAGAPPERIVLPTGLTWADLWAGHVDAMSKAATIAGRHKLLLSIEPRVNCVVGSVDAFLRLADQVGATNFGVSLDPVHALRTGDDPVLAIAKAGSHLMKLELADPREIGVDHMAPGSGILDWRAILVALDRVGYAGPLNLDAIVPKGNVDDAYTSGLQHLNEVQQSFVGRGA
jgi:D-psicose/D-tagatose/L-ribulose 3-epimerase